jgi:hypothetical protein
MQDRLDVGYFPLFLFPPIFWWQKAMEFEKIVIVVNENWVKQSFRNRVEIYGPNNRLRLSFPIVGSSKRGSIAEVKLDNSHNWSVQNWRSLVTAYNKSPFFEYYAPDLEELFKTPFDGLVDLSKQALENCIRGLNIDLKIEYCEVNYAEVSPNLCLHDFRKHESQKPYYQVFAERNGFQENLSVLDLLFNLGPEAAAYLERN